MSSQELVQKAIGLMMEEEIPTKDLTSEVLIPANMAGRAKIIARDECILAGGELATMIYMRLDSSLEVVPAISDGERVKLGDIVLNLNGRVRSILQAKDMVCSLYGRLSGIAMEAEKYVKAVEGTGTEIMDTRLTAPGMRMLDKYAAYAGGSHTNPPTLSSAFVITKNHYLALKAKNKGLKEAVKECRDFSTSPIKIYIEVTDVTMANDAIEAKPDFIIFKDMLDLPEIAALQKIMPETIKTQYYGPLNLETVRAIANTGVNQIAVPQITTEFRLQKFDLSF
ncbi:MAG: hypothetical protein FWF37_00065 [Chloroflexi bacterium]|nr:hypothetical protein [Chloroflexota bacterium]